MPRAGAQSKMVLPVRIELTTSALPRMRSTTELRQHSRLSRFPSKCHFDGVPRERRRYGRGARSKSRRAGEGKMAKRDEEREKRLAEALRENLRRRKAQARDAAAEKEEES